MSNSIWKTPDQKPEQTGNIVYVLEDGDFGNFFYIEGKGFPTVVMANQFCFVTEDTPIKMVKWTYLTDLIAQADKAERLQKAVDLAVDVLVKARGRRELSYCGIWFNKISIDELYSALNEIKQLIKGE